MAEPEKNQTKSSGREKLAALQAQQTRKKRQKLWLGALSVVVVLALVAVAIGWVVAKHNQDENNKKALANAKSTAYLSTFAPGAITLAQYNAIGAGPGAASKSNTLGLTAPATTSQTTVLTKDGKPEVLYIGAEFCPYCAMERWALTLALARFGSFKGLAPEVSDSTDTVANVPTVTYQNATYTSSYLTFVHYETADRNGNELQTPDSASAQFESQYDASTSIPFILYGNVAYTVGASYNGANVMQNASAASVAAALKDPKSQEAQQILGTTNMLTAQLCKLTDGKPGDVCSSAGVTSATKLLPAS